MKCSWGCYPYITIIERISLRGMARQRSLTQVAKGFSMSERRLLNGMRRVVLSSLSFTGRVCCFNQAWLSKATDIVGGKVGNIN